MGDLSGWYTVYDSNPSNQEDKHERVVLITQLRKNRLAPKVVILKYTEVGAVLSNC